MSGFETQLWSSLAPGGRVEGAFALHLNTGVHKQIGKRITGRLRGNGEVRMLRQERAIDAFCRFHIDVRKHGDGSDKERFGPYGPRRFESRLPADCSCTTAPAKG